MKTLFLHAVSVSVALSLSPLAAASLKVVLNEIHYHPGDDSLEGEFVEILNHGNDEADLSYWSLQGGVQYQFAAGTTLAAGDYLVIAANPALLRSRHGLAASLVLGPYSGALANDGENLELWTPDGYLVSFAHYLDAEPWPESPDGQGPSLERISPLREEHDAEAWAASIVVGGTPAAPNSARIPDPEPPPAGTSFVPLGSTWKYFKGTTTPPPSWNTNGFNDTPWFSGAAGFGYDDGDDTTVLTDMRSNYSTLYIRRGFQVVDPASVESLSLAVTYDDGYVAYLNGVEIDRINVGGATGTAVPFNAEATDFIEPPQTRIVDLSARRQLLVPGINVLAVVGVNRGIDNADFSLHPTLSGTTQSGATQSVNYVLQGSSWRFFRGTQAPPGTWRDLSFVDDAWEEGPSGFGYGDGDDATVLADMQNSYLTVFLRQRFQVVDASRIVKLTLTVNYDDGFIAYINGIEVARANVNQGNFDSPSSSNHEAGTPEAFDLSALASALRTGVNVLAISGHNADLPSSDFSLAPALAGEIVTEGGGPPPGTPPTRPPRDVVLNEVLQAGAVGWVELFNDTGATVDIGGRKISLFPASLGSYTIPAGTNLIARGRLVIDEAQLGFALAGAPVILWTTATDLFLDALNPRTAPPGHSTGRWPDGAENRHVFSTPTRNAANTLALESRVVINELQYHPGDANSGGEFIEIYNRGTQAVDISGWSFTRGVDYTFPANTTIAAGAHLVIARDPVAAQAYHGISLPLGPFLGQLKNDAETLLLRDALKNVVDRVRYADEGSWPEEPDGTGPSLELLHPALENRYGPAWTFSNGAGSPGAPNSRRANDPNPIIVGVEHTPVVPTPTENVLVTAIISDERAITAATLFYRNDGAANSSQVTMVDDGVGDDGIAGNGIYGARIPARADRTVVLFWITAQAQGGQSVTSPAAAPTPAYLYQVEAPGPEQVRPIYRLVMTAADLGSLRNRGVSSNALLNTTFIAHNKAHHLRGVRYRGSSARSCDPLSYRVQFDHDVDFDGNKDLNINGCNSHRQWIGLEFLARTGLPTVQSWFRKLALNGSVGADMYLRVEAIEEEFIERVLPAADEGGNIYRGVGQANLDYRGQDFASYSGNYEKHSNSSEADWSDIIDLCFRFDSDTTSDADFPAAIEAVVDVEEWALFFAAFGVLGSTENSILLNNGDDYFLYRRPGDGKWILLPWDLDSCFDEATQVLFRPTVAQIRRFLTHPRYAPIYWCHVESLLGTAFRNDVVTASIDHLAPLFSSARISQLQSFELARRAYIEPRIVPSITLAVTTGGTVCGNFIIASASTLTLTGTAPTCGTTEVRVNGQSAAHDVLSGTWNGNVTPGAATAITVSSRDRFGTVIAERSWTLRAATPGTALPANIASSRTLTRAQSPHLVSGTVNVGPNATLTIEAGVTLFLDQGASLVINGNLVALGTASEPVRLEAVGCGGSQEGIVFSGTGGISRLSHCVMKGLSRAAGRNAGITIDGPSLTIEDSVIESTTGNLAIEVRPGSGLLFERSEIRGGAEGIRFNGSNGTVRGSIARSIAGKALTFGSGSGGIVEWSLFLDCGTGLAVTARGSVIAEHLTLYRCGIGLDSREVQPGSGSGALDVSSTIVWATTVAVAEDAAQLAAISFSNLSGAGIRAGQGNINSDPRFVDTAASDFRLKFISPCRATGKDDTDMGAFPYESTGQLSRFLRCDTNADGENDIADSVFLLFRLFVGGASAACDESLNCNGDTRTDLTDVVFHLAFLFTGGPSPPGGFPNCEETSIEVCAQTTCLR